ncbi:hypothetical protein EAY39_27880, partial [Vibrio anguillarum]|uniref:hypothetical protein n=1 Tax=Vibrio anguillarum TaxID=55601 RepID=UPI0018C296A2
WAVSTFILAENKIDFYRAQVETAKAQVDNEKTQTELYKAKVSILESKLAGLESKNQQYLGWLNSTPKTVPAMELKIKQLENELTRSQVPVDCPKENSDSGNNSASETTTEVVKYVYSQSFKEGGSFTDPRTKVSLGVTDINGDNYFDGVLSIPGKSPIALNKKSAGYSYEFTVGSSSYRLLVTSAFWV